MSLSSLSHAAIQSFSGEVLLLVPLTPAKFTLTFQKAAALILALSFSVLAMLCELHYTFFPFRTENNCAARAEFNRFIERLKGNSPQILYLLFSFVFHLSADSHAN